MIKKIVGTLLVVAMRIVCIAPAIAQQTPFVINGYVSYANGTACDDPSVNVTNTNTSESWPAKNYSRSNYYRLVLANGTDLNATETLKFEVTSPDGNPSKIVEHTVTSEEVNNGGKFDFNITLATMEGQTWYLTPETKPDDAPTANDSLTHVRDNLMHKGSGSGTGNHFDLNYTEVAWFYADTGAECGLGFGENAWKAHIRTEGIEDDEIGHNLTVEICRLDNGTGDVTVIANHTEQLTEVVSKHLWNITCENNESTTQDFNTGDWLAVRLSWDCPTDEFRIHYKAEADSDSYIESPSSDPGYPIPELSTFVLVGVGLLVFVGYFGLRRYFSKEKGL